MLQAVTENVLLEIQKTFDFFKASASTDQSTASCSAAARRASTASTEMVQERFNAPVEDFDPFRAVAWDAKKLAGDAGALSRRPRRSPSASRCARVEDR